MSIEISPRGTRGRRLTLIFRLLSPFASMQVSRYRKDAKAEPPQMNGFPLVLLTTVGSKTGKERTAALGGYPEGEDSWLVIGSKGGSITHPAWFVNLARHPDKVWLEVGNRKFHARPELLKGDEYEAAYAKVVAVSPQYGGYRKVTDREIPVVRLTPIP